MAAHNIQTLALSLSQLADTNSLLIRRASLALGNRLEERPPMGRGAMHRRCIGAPPVVGAVAAPRRRAVGRPSPRWCRCRRPSPPAQSTGCGASSSWRRRPEGARWRAPSSGPGPCARPRRPNSAFARFCCRAGHALHGETRPCRRATDLAFPSAAAAARAWAGGYCEPGVSGWQAAHCALSHSCAPLWWDLSLQTDRVGFFKV